MGISLSDLNLQLQAEQRGIWPTPKASDGRPKGNGGQRKSPGLDQLLRQQHWQTPTAAVLTKGAAYTLDGGDPDKPRPSLVAQMAWPTPNAMMGSLGGKANTYAHYLRHREKHAARGVNAQLSLNAAIDGAAQGEWPTPQASDASRGGETRDQKAARGSGGGNLLGAPKQWQTPTANDAKNDTLPPSQISRCTLVGDLIRDSSPSRDSPPAPDALSTNGNSPDWPTPRAERRGFPDSHGIQPMQGVPNARWVAQLMGYPATWCDLPPETMRRVVAESKAQASSSGHGTDTRCEPSGTPSSPRSSSPSGGSSSSSPESRDDA